jgi:hypothetical protein
MQRLQGVHACMHAGRQLLGAAACYARFHVLLLSQEKELLLHGRQWLHLGIMNCQCEGCKWLRTSIQLLLLLLLSARS